MCTLCNDTGVIFERGNPTDFCNCPRGIGLSECYPMPVTPCPSCRNTGVVCDWVPIPFGSGNTRMESNCDCALGARLWALAEPEEAWEVCLSNE